MERRHAFRPTRSALASGLAVLVAGLVACGDPGTIEQGPVPVSSSSVESPSISTASSTGGAPAAHMD